MTRVAVYPGTFDPVTFGHIHIITRAANIFDKVIVAIAGDCNKNTFFSLEERLRLIQKSCLQEVANVEVEIFYGLLIDFMEERDVVEIIRGLRAVSDFEYEMQMGAVNKRLNQKIETVYLIADAQYFFISSSIIKNIAKLGGNIEEFVPPAVEDAVKEKLCASPNR